MEKKAIARKPAKKTVTKKVTLKKPEKKPAMEKASNVLAVIKTGGKQYKVKEGQELLVEKTEGKEGESVVFSEVLLVATGKEVKIGNPLVDKAKVEGKILSQEKGKKIVVFKMKPKKRYRKKTGHRQKITRIKIEKISA